MKVNDVDSLRALWKTVFGELKVDEEDNECFSFLPAHLHVGTGGVSRRGNQLERNQVCRQQVSVGRTSCSVLARVTNNILMSSVFMVL